MITDPDPNFIPAKGSKSNNKCYLIRKGIFESLQRNSGFLSGRLLDYGCGSKPYEHLFQVDEYLGADIESSGHPQDNKRADIFFDGRSLPIENSSFDSVLASEVFEHVFDLPGCLNDLSRILKPGGHLLATCPFVWPLHEEPYDFARYTPYALRQEFEKAGFDIEKFERVGRPVEVVGQIFLIESLIPMLAKLPVGSGFLSRAACGIINRLCPFLAKFESQESKIYLTNVILAVKKPAL